MAKKIYDLKVKTGEYTNSQGEKKGRWQTVGMIMQGDDGKEFIMINRIFNPAGVPDLTGKGGDAILVSKFEPKNGDGYAPAPATTAAAGQGGTPNSDADDIPF